MNYELCKELKDAGFPQGDEYIPGQCIWDEVNLDDGDLCYLPTLSELIEACVVDDDFHLELGKDSGWQASVCLNHQGEWEDWYGGKTPEEAVAELWLALNKK